VVAALPVVVLAAAAMTAAVAAILAAAAVGQVTAILAAAAGPERVRMADADLVTAAITAIRDIASMTRAPRQSDEDTGSDFRRSGMAASDRGQPSCTIPMPKTCFHSAANLEFRFAALTAIDALNDGFLLFNQDQQLLHHLNATSGILALRLMTGARWEDLVSVLDQAGIDRQAAETWSEDFLLRLARLNLLEARGARQHSGEGEQIRVEIGGMTLELVFGSPELFRDVGGAYFHLPHSSSQPDQRYTLLPVGELVLIGDGCGWAAAVERRLAAVRLKGLIIEDLLTSGAQVAAFHSSSVIRDANTILLLGSPGAGKTTFALALMQHGYNYCAEDVTLLDGNGLVRGVALAPSVKASGWKAIEELGIELANEPTHLRPDGQEVRFAPIGMSTCSKACAVAAVVKLHRSPLCKPKLVQKTHREGLLDLMAEARTGSGRCTPEVIHAISRLLRSASCFDLHYDEAFEAAALFENLATRG
jgi:hypothetical protein